MNISTIKSDSCHCSIKVLIFKFANLAPINCICKVCPKFFYIKIICPLPNLLIWCKSYSYFPMFYLRIINEILHRSNYFNNTSFIICTKQSVSIGCYYILTNIFFKFWKFIWFQKQIALLI